MKESFALAKRMEKVISSMEMVATLKVYFWITSFKGMANILIKITIGKEIGRMDIWKGMENK